MVFEAVLQLTNASFDLLPWRLCHPRQLRYKPAWRTCLTWLHPFAPCKCRCSFRFGKKRRYGRQRLLLSPGATRSSRAVPLRRHALIAEGRALPMTNATGVIMHGGNLLTTTATGLITDGRGLPMATLTGLNGPIITGVPSRGHHRSSIRTDRRLVGCVCRDALKKLLRKKLRRSSAEKSSPGEMWSTSWAHSAKASKWNGQGEASGGSEVAPAPDEPNEPTAHVPLNE